MADFCKQCSKEMDFPEPNDFHGRVTEFQFKNLGLVAVGICEGCSGGEFDYEGNCMGFCDKKDHKSPHEKELKK